MEVLGEAQLQAFYRKHPQARKPLEDWLGTVRSMHWRNTIELRVIYSSADGNVKGGHTVFNIKGNKYRLVVGINYVLQQVDIVEVFTHAEYTKWSKL